MCIQREPYNYSSDLYLKHSKVLIEYFVTTIKPQLEQVSQYSPQYSPQYSIPFLRVWIKVWRNAKHAVDGMERMFMYLDRVYVPNSDETLLTTRQQGYHLFRNHVFDHFKDIATMHILECINQERDGEEQESNLLTESIQVSCIFCQCLI